MSDSWTKFEMKKVKQLPKLQPGSLNRAVTLMTAIAQGSRKGSLLTELVARTGLPRPTIHRVLNALMSYGWVVRHPETSRFNLGLDLAALGYTAISRNPLERLATTELSQLANTIDQVVYLGIRSDFDMVCIGRYESQSQIQVGKGWVGLRGPFGMSPSCMAMLAHLPEKDIEEIVSANMSRYHRIEGFDERGFRRTLAEATKMGFSTYDDIILDRTTSGLGVPVLDPSGYPIAGIGTTYLSGWLNEGQKMERVRHMQQAARRISSKLFPGQQGAVTTG
ncbi:MAG TPA: IclR family transcriptional regulator [Methylophilaceae bacterium]|nr:IclR family transcriptional regulator [Methylophilaceae bacterium]